jgi:hypothetical protein
MTLTRSEWADLPLTCTPPTTDPLVNAKPPEAFPKASFFRSLALTVSLIVNNKNGGYFADELKQKINF